MMRLVLQRVSEGRVFVDGRLVGSIGSGVVILLGVERGDTPAEVMELAGRAARFQIFEDERGRMGRSLLEEKGAALVVSQVTLARQPHRGIRPSFDQAARPAEARALYERFCEQLRKLGVDPVETGTFGARMQVELVGEGPVTFVFEGGSMETDSEANGLS